MRPVAGWRYLERPLGQRRHPPVPSRPWIRGWIPAYLGSWLKSLDGARGDVRPTPAVYGGEALEARRTAVIGLDYIVREGS